MSILETTCTYATLKLHDDGIPITAEKIGMLLKAAGVSVDSYWPSLFAKLFEKKNVEDLIANIGIGGGAAVAVAAPSGVAASGAAPLATAATEEKKEEKEKESDEDMGFNLFD